MDLPTDFLGRTIRAGDTVVYPWRRGSTMGLDKLTLSQVADECVSGYDHLGHRVIARTSRTW